MTYREKIQNMVEQINTLYNEAEWLRDIATGEEKQYWNAHRKIFYDAAQPLRKLDNSLHQDRADSCICINTFTERKYVFCCVCQKEYLKEVRICKDCKNYHVFENGSDCCNAELNL